MERGEFVYRKGELLYGKGDPHTPIVIAEEAAVFTMAYAVEHGIWPRKKPQPDPIDDPPPPDPDPDNGDKGQGQAGPGPKPIVDPEPLQPQQPELLRAEGVLKEALNRIFEQAVARKVAAITSVSIRVFEPADGFRLLGVVGAIRTAEVRASIQGEFETPQRSSVAITFDGVPQDALPLRDFLDPQLKLAAEKDLTVVFSLLYKDGLATSGGTLRT